MEGRKYSAPCELPAENRRLSAPPISPRMPGRTQMLRKGQPSTRRRPGISLKSSLPTFLDFIKETPKCAGKSSADTSRRGSANRSAKRPRPASTARGHFQTLGIFAAPKEKANKKKILKIK